MRKRKTKKPNRTLKRVTRPWTDEETGTLLVWLDHCIERKLPFEDTVVQHLKQRWPQKCCTHDSIISKLRRLWNGYGKDKTKFQDFFILGTKCLNWIELEPYQNAKAELKESGKNLNYRRISTANGPRVRRLRSSTRSPGMIDSAEQSNSDDPLIETSKKKRGIDRRKRVKLIDVSHPQDNNKPSISPTGLTKPLVVINNATDAPESFHGPSEGDDNSLNQDNATQLVSLQSHINPDFLPREDLYPEENFRKAIEEKDALILNAKVEILTLQEIIAQRDGSLSEVRLQNDALSQSTSRLTNQVSRLFREIEDYKIRLKVQDECWRASRKNSTMDVEEVLNENEKTITSLKYELSQCRRLSQIEMCQQISGPDIAKAIGWIEYRSKTLFYRSDIIFQDKLVPSGVDQIELLQRRPIFQQIADAAEEDIANLTESIGIRNILRILMSDILREWIFESDFYNFDDRESELLAVYRKILLEQNDSHMMRNIDFVAQSTLFKGPYFREHILTRTTKEMSTKFSNLVAPFFPSTSPASLSDGTPTWGQSEEVAALRRLHCEDVFESALKLKADLVLTTCRYEMKTFNPGTLLNPKTMRSESKEGGSIGNMRHGKNSKIKTCLFPAFYLHPVEALSSEQGQGEVMSADVSKVLVQCQNFLLSDNHRTKGCGTLISKAVVLMGD